MNALFVLPPFDLSASYGSTNKMKRGFLPSLGVGHLASMVESRGHNATLVDAQVTAMNPVETVEAILEHDPDIVGISAMNVYAHAAYAVALELKTRCPGVTIVLGGPHATSFHRVIFDECPAIDVVIPGDGEIPFADLCDRIAARESWHAVKGLHYRDEQGVVRDTGRAPIVEDLDDLPAPARHIYAPYEYRPLPNQVRREPATTAITSRGCSWAQCTFCFQGGEYSPKYRRRSPAHVLAELTPLVREHGIREIMFWDDTFAVHPKWIEDFCDGLKREKLDITWSCYGHMRSIKRDMLFRMADAGCYNLYYGFESGVDEILKLVKKGTTRDEIRKAVRWAKEADIEVRGSFILGFPKETPEQTLETIRFACELNTEWMMFFPFHVSPGTPIEALAHQEGHIFETQRSLHFPEYKPDTYESRDQLHAMVRKAYMKYYLRPRYWGLVAQNLIRRPYMFKYYYDAVKFWMELTSNGLRVEPEKAETTDK